MSHDQRDLYYHDPFHDDQRTNETLFSFFGPSSTIRDDSSPPNHERFHDYMGFTQFLNGSTDYNTPATTFGYSSASSQVFATEDDHKPVMDPGNLVGTIEANPLTPNSSSVRSSSTEAVDDEHELDDEKKENQPKGLLEEGGDTSKKV